MKCPLCVNEIIRFRKFHTFVKHLTTKHNIHDLAFTLADLLDILEKKRKLDKKKEISK